MAALAALKSLDIFPKTAESYRVRTYAGAAVSLVSACLIVFLFFSELSSYMSTEVQPHLSVDTSRGERLRINIDITFPRLPCSYMSLDAMDISGETQLDVAHNVFKRRLNKEGFPIAVEKEELNKAVVKVSKNITIPKNQYGCGSCYGAETADRKCCETCEDVREAYRLKGWAFASAGTIAQCVESGFEEQLEAQKDEGCQVYGYLMVQKVAGNFHVAPGKSFQSHHTHVHDMQPFKLNNWDLSHTINKLSFGTEFPGVVNPLDGTQKTSDPGQSAMYQYFIKVVPTIYEHIDGQTINTNQFSASEYYRLLGNDQKGAHGLPGVFFMYDLSPIKVRYVESQHSLATFLTGVCAIIGGVYTVSGLMDSFIYNATRKLREKQRMGKAN